MRISELGRRSVRSFVRTLPLEPISGHLDPDGDRDLSDSTFEDASHVGDWRNHVPATIEELWPTLSLRERLLVSEVAQLAADYEDEP